MIIDYFKNIEFTHPWFFALGTFIPVIIFWYVKKNNQQQGAIIVSDISASNLSSWKTILRHIPFVLRLFTLIFIILALANPQISNTTQHADGAGIDIIICTDVSGSMSAKDLEPNRIEAAKKVMVNFIQERVTDNIGVVLFAGESFTLCPLTTDKAVLQNSIEAIRIGFLNGGTAIGDGLGTSVDRLKESKAKSKIIILLTDGENTEGNIDPSFAKEIAKVYGVKIYTIGVGRDGDVDVPEETALGVVVKKERFTLNETLLKQIATETGGQYFRATDNKSLQSIYTEIDTLEKSKVEITSTTKYTNRFFPFALAAMFFLFLEIVLKLTVFKKFP